MDVASPPSLAPQLNIFVIQLSFASSWKHLFKYSSRRLFNGLSRHIILSSPVVHRLRYLRFSGSGLRYPRLASLFYYHFLSSKWIRCWLSQIYRPKSDSYRRRSNFYVLIRPPPLNRNPPFQTPKSSTDILINSRLSCRRLRQSYGLMVRLLAIQLRSSTTYT